MLYFSDARGVDGVGTAFCSTAGVRVATVGLLSRLLGSFAQFFRVTWGNWLHNWGAFHVRPLRFGVMRENALSIGGVPKPTIQIHNVVDG